jgi:sugar O-acyltransferase (sialic acid O-acetyltransferase NeuD family)
MGLAAECIPVAILGGYGSGQIVAESVWRLQQAGSPFQLLGFLNDDLAPGASTLGATVLGRFETWCNLPIATRFIAPLHKAKLMARRATRIRELAIPRERWTHIVDPRANLAAKITVGHGTHVDALATVQPAVRVGAHVAIRAGAVVGHHVELGDFCFVGANATVTGYGCLEEGVHVGANACVRERLRIGRYAVLGAGAVVLHDVPAGAIMLGNPARQAGEVEP